GGVSGGVRTMSLRSTLVWDGQLGAGVARGHRQGVAPRARRRSMPPLRLSDTDLARRLVDGHPDAMLVQDGERRLVAYNRAAGLLLGEELDRGSGAGVACRLLGCRRPGGPLEGLCVHELAREAPGAASPG